MPPAAVWTTAAILALFLHALAIHIGARELAPGAIATVFAWTLPALGVPVYVTGMRLWGLTGR